MKKKLLFVISSLNTGGAQSAMANLSIALSSLYDIDWLLNSDEKIAYEYRGNIKTLGLHEPKNRESITYQGKAFFKRLSKIKRLKKTGKYVATISFLESANIANVLTGNKKSRVIISQRCTVATRKMGLKGKVLIGATKILYKRADEMVAISDGVRSELIEMFGLNPATTTTILNGYDIESIRKKSKENPGDFKKERDTFVFVNMGRLHNQKGQWHLIRAFSKVFKEKPESRLVIIGSGEEEEYLSGLIKGYHLEDVAKVLPYRENPFAVLDKCDAFVFPSLFEGFGNVLCEALACGLPVISSDYRSGAREILAPESDFNKEIKDSEEFAKYGILVPVCSGIKYGVDEELEFQEQILAKVMLKLMGDNTLFEKYKYKAEERSSQLSFENKFVEWKEIIER